MRLVGRPNGLERKKNMYDTQRKNVLPQKLTQFLSQLVGRPNGLLYWKNSKTTIIDTIFAIISYAASCEW